MAIVSQEELIVALGLGDLDAAQRDKLNWMQGKVQAAIAQRVGSKLEQGTFTEFLPNGPARSSVDSYGPGEIIGNYYVPTRGGNDAALQLKNMPIRSIVSIHEDAGAMGGQAPGAFGASTLLTAGVDYYVDFDEPGISRSGLIYRTSGGWLAMPRAIKVVYVGGFSAEEFEGHPSADIDASDIKLAIIETMDAVLNSQGGPAGAISSESTVDYSVTFSTAEIIKSIPASAAQRLRPYCNFGRFT